MKKTLLSTLFFCCFFTSTFAQEIFNKNITHSLGGSIYSTNSASNTGSNYLYQTRFTLDYGRMINFNKMKGTRIGFNFLKNGGNSGTSVFGTLSREFILGGYTRNYNFMKSTFENPKLGYFMEFDFEGKYGFRNSYTFDMYLRAIPGIYYTLSDKLTLEFMFGNAFLGFGVRRNEQIYHFGGDFNFINSRFMLRYFF